MNPVAAHFDELRRNHRKALVPFFTGGFPSLKASYDFAHMALSEGADMLEIGVPFSDPMADGPAIQFSSQKALDNGTRLKDIFAIVEKLRAAHEQPIILMGYYNPVIAGGMDHFLKAATQCGTSGLIIPDLPVEEGEIFRQNCDKHGIGTIFLIAPTSDAQRIKKIEELSSGFVYAVSIAGITGARTGYGPQTINYFKRLRKSLRKPYVIGFGIASPEMASQACHYADGAVIGSAFVDMYRRAKNQAMALKKAQKFLRQVRKEI